MALDFFFLMHYCWPDPIFSSNLPLRRRLPPRAAGPGVTQIKILLEVIKCLVNTSKDGQAMSLVVHVVTP